MGAARIIRVGVTRGVPITSLIHLVNFALCAKTTVTANADRGMNDTKH